MCSSRARKINLARRCSLRTVTMREAPAIGALPLAPFTERQRHEQTGMFQSDIGLSDSGISGVVILVGMGFFAFWLQTCEATLRLHGEQRLGVRVFDSAAYAYPISSWAQVQRKRKR